MRSFGIKLALIAALLGSASSAFAATKRVDELAAGGAASGTNTLALCTGAPCTLVQETLNQISTFIFSLIGGDFTISSIGGGTLATVNTTVGSYTNMNCSVDAKGRVSNCSNGSSSSGGTVTQNGNLATGLLVTGGTNGTSDIRTNTTGTGVLLALNTSVGTPGAFLKNNGDAMSGTYTGSPNFTGQFTLSGIPSGTIAAGGNLGLNSSNQIVKASVAGGATAGFGVDGGTTPQSVTGGATINNVTDEVWINTGWVTGTLQLPATANIASHKCIRIHDGKNYVDASHTVTIQPDATDAINGGTNGVATGAYQNAGLFLIACAQQETHNWTLGPGSLAASTAPSNKFATGIDRNGLIYGFATLAGLSDVNLTSLANGNTITYDSVSGKWINSTPAGGGNVSGTGPFTSGNVMTGNGSTTVQDSGVAISNVVKTNVAQTFSAAQTFGEVHGAINAQTGTTYTLAATDCGKILKITNVGAITLTVPNSISGVCAVAVQQGGAGQITVTAGGGATLNAAHSYTKTAAQHSIISLSNSGSTAADWILSGDGA